MSPWVPSLVRALEVVVRYTHPIRWLHTLSFVCLDRRRGLNYSLVSCFTWMYCGDLISADKDYLSKIIDLLMGYLNYEMGRCCIV